MYVFISVSVVCVYVCVRVGRGGGVKGCVGKLSLLYVVRLVTIGQWILAKANNKFGLSVYLIDWWHHLLHAILVHLQRTCDPLRLPQNKRQKVSNLKIGQLECKIHGWHCSEIWPTNTSWTPLQRHLKWLHAFHHHWIHSVLGITHRQQWAEHITSEAVHRKWGDVETITIKLMKCWLERLVHVARMSACRIILFGWLPQPCRPKWRWRNIVKKDLHQTNISMITWYDEEGSGLKYGMKGWQSDQCMTTNKWYV